MRKDARCGLILCKILLLSACASVSLDESQRPMPPVQDAQVGAAVAPATPGPRPATPAPGWGAAPGQAPTPDTRPPPRKVSQAADARAYRQDAASHIYAHNAHRIYKGMLQPNLYAIGVLQVDIDRGGAVRGLRWMRAPSHAPEVISEIERTVRAAAPFPEPARMGRVTYTDVWLWDKSGLFQLDTLTEGQL